MNAIKNIEAKKFFTKKLTALKSELIIFFLSDTITAIYRILVYLNTIDETTKNKDHMLITNKSCLLNADANSLI